MSEDRLKERVLMYLYGEMSPAEEEVFKAELEENSELARLLTAEERFQRLCPTGTGPQVAEELLAESRLLLRATLRQEARRSPSLLARLAKRVREMAPGTAFAGGMVAALLAGVILGRTLLTPETPREELALTGLVSMNRENGSQVIDLRVGKFDLATGHVKLSLRAVSSVEVEGRVQDAAIQNVLAAALQGDLEPGARLEVVELLRYQTARIEIREALVHALLRDENPGVRIKAVETLKGLAGDEQVRQALRTALLEDGNPGVRVAAIEALRQFQDQATLQVLERKMQVDENEYIRAEAGRALNEWRTASQAQQL